MLLRVTARGFLLMRRMSMVLALEVFGLMWGALSIPGHGVLQSRK
jgi:hypothetical protein